MSDPIKSFRENKHNTETLMTFLKSSPGQEFQTMLRQIRAGMTSDKSVSEPRVCGRHDVFEKLDDLLFVGSQYMEPKPKPLSEKAGNHKVKPHVSNLP